MSAVIIQRCHTSWCFRNGGENDLSVHSERICCHCWVCLDQAQCSIKELCWNVRRTVMQCSHRTEHVLVCCLSVSIETQQGSCTHTLRHVHTGLLVKYTQHDTPNIRRLELVAFAWFRSCWFIMHTSQGEQWVVKVELNFHLQAPSFRCLYYISNNIYLMSYFYLSHLHLYLFP